MDSYRKRYAPAALLMLSVAAAHASPAAPTTASPTGTTPVSGIVWHDMNGNGRRDGREPGVAASTLDAIAEDGTVIASVVSDRGGRFTFPADILAGGRADIQMTPPPGFHPTPKAVGQDRAAGGNDVADGLAFGVAAYRQLRMKAPRIDALAHCDMMERDRVATNGLGARRDQDLIAGASISGTDQLSVWFNRFDHSRLFTSARDYARPAPQSVLALAAGALTRDADPSFRRPDLVAGTRRSAAGNLFVWFNQSTTANEGHLRAGYSLAFSTLDHGDVQAVAIGDVAGGPGLDWIAGTRATPGRGSIEAWTRDDTKAPSFTRAWTSTHAGGVELGEVHALALSPLASGVTFMIAGTRTGDRSGQIVVWRRDEAAGFELAFRHAFDDGAVTSLAALDLTCDGVPEVVVGLQESGTTGRIEVWSVTDGAELLTRRAVRHLPSGFPLCLAGGDFGGDGGMDLVCGWRADANSLAGGVRVYAAGPRGLALRPVDPSAGTVTGMVPALTVADFDGSPGRDRSCSFGDDIAAAVVRSPIHGGIVVLVR